jgi:prolyl-tRNA editing enzyme YbaK/EbsC (Cys-tRNA(Pro) deacylase)
MVKGGVEMSERRDGLSDSARRVQQALDRYTLDFQVLELPDSTRTARDAAQAIGCEVGQIAKSLVFRFLASEMPLLVIASGAIRVNVDLVGHRLGGAIVMADADYVRASTGFAIGGVPPLGHTTPIRTKIIDQEIMQYQEIWAAAGTPHAVFRLTPDDLIRITKGELMQVS